MHEGSPRAQRAAVVFDMDGTLFDSTACVTRAYRETVIAAGGPDYSADDIVAAYPVGPPATILAHLLGHPATKDDEKAYLARLHQHRDLISLYDGIRDVLDHLSGRVPLAVFTGASAVAATQLLTATRLLSYFSVVVGGDDVPRPKPEPDGVLRACELLGVSRSAWAPRSAGLETPRLAL